MKKTEELIHYCDDSKKQYVVCNISNPGNIQSWRFDIPYESQYLFDTVQIGRVIYFSGGGFPGLGSLKEQFYHSVQKVTLSLAMTASIDKLAGMINPRSNHSMTAINDSFLYVAGGTNLSGDLSSCEEYSIAANKWREIASLNERKKWISLLSLNKDYIYAFGGCKDADLSGTSTIEFLHLPKMGKTWNLVKLVKGSDIWAKRFFVGTYPLSGTRILIFGGTEQEKEKSDCFIFDSTNQIMMKSSPLLKADAFYRTKPGLEEGKIIVVGSNSCDLHKYSLDSGTWDCELKSVWYPELPAFGIKPDTF